MSFEAKKSAQVIGFNKKMLKVAENRFWGVKFL